MTDLRELFKEFKKEQSVKKEVNDRVLLIDGYNTYLRNFSVNPRMNDNGEHVGGMIGFLQSVAFAVRTFLPTRCIVVFDGKNSALRRRKLYPDYKMGRKTRIRLNRTFGFEDYEQEKQSMKVQLIRLMNYLDTLPITVIHQENIEADDVMAYIAKNLLKKEVIIYSTDKDFFQLIDDRITVYNPVQKKTYDRQAIYDRYEIYPENFVYYRMIDGDKSDNISGISGFGLKTIKKNFPVLCEDRKLQIDDFLGQVRRKKDSDETIQKNNSILERNYELMQLQNVNISARTALQIRDKVEEIPFQLDKYSFLLLFSQDKVHTAIKNVNDWLRSFRVLDSFCNSRHRKFSVRKKGNVNEQ